VHAEGASEGEVRVEEVSRAPYIGRRGKGRRRPRRWGHTPAAAINGGGPRWRWGSSGSPATGRGRGGAARLGEAPGNARSS
jgi:hypothetical protein